LNHAGATKVYIRLMKAGGLLFIIYRDNGTGLPPGKDLKGYPGMGFANIESRLKAIGGTIELNQSEHQGFSVSITCPVGLLEEKNKV
jgi:signal transduction histidine kinase